MRVQAYKCFANVAIHCAGKSLTNELVDKFYVSMQQVVQNLLDQPEFKAIICAYVEHTQHQIDARLKSATCWSRGHEK